MADGTSTTPTLGNTAALLSRRIFNVYNIAPLQCTFVAGGPHEVILVGEARGDVTVADSPSHSPFMSSPPI